VGRGDDDEFLEISRLFEIAQHFGGLCGELVLFELMEVGLFHGASHAARTGECPSRLVRTLIAGRRILLFAATFEPEDRFPEIADITQHQELLAIGNEDKGIVVNVHIIAFV
jgi:hypothetical protein